MKTFELFQQRFPIIPKIVANTPHICILIYTRSGRKRCFSRRSAKNDFSTCFLNGLANSFYFRLMIRAAKIIDFDKINAPRSNKLHERVVILLCTGFSHVHSIHVRIPCTCTLCICNISGMGTCSLYRRILFYCLTRNAAHHVNTKLKTFGVNIICQCFKTIAIYGRREFLRSRNQPTKFIHRQFCTFCIFIPLGVLFVPLNIYHKILPAMFP